MRKAGLGIFAAALMAASVLTGCSTLDRIIGADNWESWVPSRTSLQLSPDGKLKETIIDKLDRNYYNADELQDMIARTVREYNEGTGHDALTVMEYTVEGTDLKLVIDYASGSDYRDYNQMVFFDGSMLDAEMEGFLFANNFRKVERGKVVEEDIPSSEALSHKEYRVAVVDEGHDIQVPGNIRYVSANAEPLNSHAAGRRPSPAPDQKETDTGLVLPSNAVYYKPTGEEETENDGMGPVSEEDIDRTYMYVLYQKDPMPD